MLTKTDFFRIRKVVREEIHGETYPKFRQIDLRFGTIDKRFDKVDRNMKKLDKKLDFVSGVFDREHIRAMKRIERVEDHLNMPRPLY